MKKDAKGRYDFQVGPEHVGANLLDIVSGALYSDVLDIVREYIQNAVDAGASRVRLVLRPKEIWIRDNGSGMTPAGLDEARKVAVSAKRGHAVGFRGIGIYSSFAASDSLEVITRPQGGTGVYSLRLEFRGMRREAEARAAAETSTPLPLQEALARFTEIRDFDGEVPMDDGGAFTLIRISRPNAHLREALEDEVELTKYLRRAVPLNFPPGHPIATEVVKGLKKYGVERRGIDVDLTPNGKDPMKSGASTAFYMDEFKELLRPSVRTLRASNGQLLGVLWFAVHKEPSVIPNHAHGIQIRIKGFGIGDVVIPQRVWTAAGSGVLYRHLVGELHVVHPALRPSAERANIEDSPVRKALMKRLQAELKKINFWIHNRQKVIGRIVKGNEKSVADTDAYLDKLCDEYGADPRLKRAEILNDAATSARKSEKGKGGGGSPSDPGGGNGGGGGGGGDGGDRDSGGSGGDTNGPPPKLSKMLMDLNVRWPRPANKVFTVLDDAVQELDEDTQIEFRSAVRDHLVKLVL